MTERPIIFSGAMVRAILAGTKTQTRRSSVIDDFETKSHPDGITTWRVNFSKPVKGVLGSYSGTLCTAAEAQRIIASQFCPYGSVGDRLWGREAHSIHNTHGQHRDDGLRWGPWGGLPVRISPDGKQIAYYREGFDRCYSGRWRPSIHMPRWACRIVLEITDVRVERLQDISEADADAEGVRREVTDMGRLYFGTDAGANDWTRDPREAFRELWESINGAGSWDANPWVWAITFKRLEPAHAD